MVKLSEEAATQIKKMQNDQANAEHRLRIFVETGGCSGFEYGMSFDAQKEDDEVLEDQGIQFFMDPTSLDYLKGSVVQFDDGLTGKGFQIINPNAENTCGCGRSFN
jgi:iron-sulfur cluster assembly protein/iron-sulfur cluster insertion protein